MQHKNQFTSFFTIPNPKDSPQETIRKRFVSMDALYKTKIPTEPFGYLDFGFNKKYTYHALYNIIIKNYAEYFGVKVMYWDQLNEAGEPVKGYRFIGDKLRIETAVSLVDYTIDMLSEVRLTLKGPEFLFIIDQIADIIHKRVIHDLKYDAYLEKYIMNHFKLDYKKYNTNDVFYWHAVSNRYVNKRMML